MAYKTCIYEGNFTSDGTDKVIQMRSDVDWVKVYNLTNIAGAAQWAGTEWYWQRGMLLGDAVVNYHAAASQLISTSTCVIGYNGEVYGGIAPISSEDDPVGVIDATVTAVSNAVPPVVTCNSTAGLNAGNIVRMINVTAAQQLGGIDFTIGNGTFSATTFSLDYMPGIVAGTAGSFRKINYDPIFYPRRRFIATIDSLSPAIVAFTVTHGYTIGQRLRFTVPASYGMTQMDGLEGTVTAVYPAVNAVAVNIDATAFSDFSYPLSTAGAKTQALCVPVGEDPVDRTGKITLEDATYDTGMTGFSLATSPLAPIALGSAGGTTGDAIKWIAGKSFNV